MSELSDIHEVGVEEREALIAWLGDTPETAMSVHRLRRGLGRGVVLGTADRPQAAIVQAHLLPSEPAAIGEDAEAIWAVLQGVIGWEAVHVTPQVARPLADLIARGTGTVGPLVEEPYFVLDRPVPSAPHPAVRRLTEADLPTMEAATDVLGLHGWRFGSAAAQIAEGFAAGAVVDGELIAVCFTSNRSTRHAEIGIVTRKDHRNRGLSTAAAALVLAEIQAAGLKPVWSTSVDNTASQRVAAKLGFAEVSRRVYINRV